MRDLLTGTRWQLPALLALCALTFFWDLGALPLFDLDEGAFSAATWEMLQRGDFVTTWLNGEPRFDKPILIYWLQAASVSLFGLSEWALRLPSALAATAWMLTLYQFVREQTDAPTAFFAAALGATSAGVLLIGRAAIADALLNLWLALALFDLYRYYVQPRRALRLRVFLWIGLGLLTKGPIALAVPVVVSFIFFALRGHLGEWFKAAFCPLGWLVMLGVALPWYVLEYLAQGQAFIDGFFLKHNVGRFADTMEGHGGSVFYYFGAILLVLMPYSGLLLDRLRLWHAMLRDELEQFLLIWFGFVFVFFSLSSTQLPHYLLYGLSPVLVWLARHRAPVAARWLVVLPPLAFLLVLVALPELLDLARERQTVAYVRETLALGRAEIGAGFRWAAVGLALALIGLWRMPRDVLPAGLLAFGTVHALFLMQGLLPIVAAAQQGPVREAALTARALDAPVVMTGLNMPSFTVYREAITPRRAPEPGEIAFTRVDRVDALGAHEVVFQRGGIILARRLPPP